ncbi:MAG: hypothetical protein U1E73_09850 [Planctomycetota bacterium]
MRPTIRNDALRPGKSGLIDGDGDSAGRGSYLLLSTATGFVELGAVIGSLLAGCSQATVLVIALLYQIGAIFANPLRLPYGAYVACAGIAVVCAAVATQLQVFLLPAVIFFAVGTQGIRDAVLARHPVSTFAKRVSRVMGFALGGYFSLWGLTTATIGVLAIGLLRGVRKKVHHDVTVPSGTGASKPWCIAMLVHQMHYFAYAYTLPPLFVRDYGFGTASGVAFALGWVTYSGAPSILRKLPDFVVVTIGHGVVALLLVSMAINHGSSTWVMIAWCATGLGGGTVYGIRRLAHGDNAQARNNMDGWENIGHVGGVLVALALVLAEEDATILFMAGGVLALLVIPLVANARLRGLRKSAVAR